MLKNNTNITWKAVIAVLLVMVSLVSMSSVVSASFIELILEEVGELYTLTSSNNRPCEAVPRFITCAHGVQTGCEWVGCTCGTCKNTYYPQECDQCDPSDYYEGDT